MKQAKSRPKGIRVKGTSLPLRLAPSAGNALANTVPECEANNFRTRIIFITAYPKDAAFPSGEKGGRLLCSAFAFPRLNCSRRQVLKLVSPHTQLLATRGETGADRSPHAQSHRKTAIPATMQMRIRLGDVESAGFPKRSAIFDQPLPTHEQGHEGR